MAIVMEANYSKKVGLPGYSSHQYMITLRTELADLSQIEAESARLHNLLQSAVDREIQKVGYLPANGITSANGRSNGNGKNHANGNNRPPRSQGGNGNTNGYAHGSRDHWNCSLKQKQYILDLVEEHQLDKNQVEQLAQDRFGKSVRTLNKLEASGLIEELKEQLGGSNSGNNRVNGRATYPAPAR